MEVVIPLLAAAGLIFAGKSDKKQNDNSMLNRETMTKAKKEAFTNMGQDKINPQNLGPNYKST